MSTGEVGKALEALAGGAGASLWEFTAMAAWMLMYFDAYSPPLVWGCYPTSVSCSGDDQSK